MSKSAIIILWTPMGIPLYHETSGTVSGNPMFHVTNISPLPPYIPLYNGTRRTVHEVYWTMDVHWTSGTSSSAQRIFIANLDTNDVEVSLKWMWAVTCEGLDRRGGDSWLAAASMAFLDRAQDVACLVTVALGEVDLKDVRLVSLLNWVIYLELSAMSKIAKS